MQVVGKEGALEGGGEGGVGGKIIENYVMDGHIYGVQFSLVKSTLLGGRRLFVVVVQRKVVKRIYNMAILFRW